MTHIHPKQREQSFLVFAVLVGYGAKDLISLRSSLSSSVARLHAHEILVDTSQALTFRDGRSVNEAFEFSGYQYGLEQAIDAALQAGCVESDNLVVFLLNDTATRTHLPGLARLFLHRVIRRIGGFLGHPVAIGSAYASPAPLSSVASQGYYFATCMLCLSAPVNALRRVTFYDGRLAVQQRFQEMFNALSADYQMFIHQWLNPTGFFNGWYKASMFRKTDSATVHRKSLATYLELSLPTRLLSCGFSVWALEWDKSSRSALLSKFCQWADRCFVNLLKTKHRLGEFVKEFARRF